MNHLPQLLLLFMLGAAPGWAQSLSPDVGTSWVRIPVSGRDAALGQSSAASPELFDAVELDPASIVASDRSALSFSENFWAQGLSLSHITFTPGGKDAGFSLSGDYINFGGIPTYSVTGNQVTANGTYNPMGLSLGVGYGFSIWEGLRAGFTFRFLYDNIQVVQSDETVALDGALLYSFSSVPLSISVGFSDLGPNLDDAALPLQWKAAAAVKAAGNLTLTGESDWRLLELSESSFGLGAEYWYAGRVALRAGYRFAGTSDLVGLTGLSLGAAIRFLDWQIDYALVTLGDFGTSNLVSLSLTFGGDRKIPKTAVSTEEGQP